ncbi:MAG: hypothetical protein ACPGUV_08290 [Polyangiales bacterium]
MLLLACSLLHCAPSFRQQHESKYYFERCYEARFRPEISAGRQAHCWRRWLRDYAHAAHLQRRHYARQALAAAARGQRNGPVMSPRGPVDAESVGWVAPRHGEVGDAPQEQGAGVPHGCAAICRSPHRRCMQRCRRNDYACARACDSERDFCERGCY